VLNAGARGADSDRMTRLREPISPVQVAVYLLMVGGVVVSQRWLGIVMNPLDWFALAVAAEFVIQPISTLVHELGHAGAVVAYRD
jgi:hypothetical protein